MTVSPLKKLVLPGALVAGSVFSALTVPLAIFGSEPVVIQLNQEPIFSGKLKDVATPYVGVAGALSVCAGVASIAIAGWSHSSRKSEKIEEELSNLQQQLKEKENQLEAALFSDTRLEASGLDFFLEDETTVNKTASTTQPKQQRLEVETELPAVSYAVSEQSNLSVDPSKQAVVQSAVSPLAAAQSFLSFNRNNALGEALIEDPQAVSESLPVNINLKELQEQLMSLVSQVETLQSSVGAQHQTHRSAQMVDHSERGNHRLPSNQSWVVQNMAS